MQMNSSVKLLYLQSENRRKDIHFYINSPGGSVTATMAIYDTMQILSCPVATYCVGLAASGGAVLLAGGAAGKRFSLPHAKVMIHQPYGQVGGQVGDIEIQADEINYKPVLFYFHRNSCASPPTGQPIERIAQDLADREQVSPRSRRKPKTMVSLMTFSLKHSRRKKTETLIRQSFLPFIFSL